MTGLPDSMWRSPARLNHPDHHCSHSHEHGRRDRHRGSERRHDPGDVTRQQDSAKRAKTATSSRSKATEGDSAGWPSRSSDRSRRQFHPASLWWDVHQCAPVSRRRQPQGLGLRLRRQILPSGLPGPVTEVADSFIQRLCGGMSISVLQFLGEDSHRVWV